MPDMQRRTTLKPEKIHALTSLRFFAAFLVMVFHAGPDWFSDLPKYRLLSDFIGMGFTAVPFFFLLSGYILAVVYLRRETPIHKRQFFVARFARIYPLFFLTLVADTPNLLVARIYNYGLHSAILKTSVTFVANVFMLQAWVAKFGGIDNPNWSLSAETFFYILFPFLGPILWRLRNRSIWIWGAALWLAGQIGIYLLHGHMNEDLLRKNPLLHTPTFLLGILLARWQVIQQQKHGASPRTAFSVWAGLAFAIAGFCVAAYWVNTIPYASLNGGLLALPFACAIWIFSANKHLPAQVMSPSWLVVLGEASYGLYLIHFAVLHFFLWRGWDKIPSFFAIYLISCVALSLLSFYFVETPTRKWILKLLHTRPKETVEVAADAQ